MGLKTRLTALERKLGDTVRENTVVILVASFEPGPDAEPDAPGRIVVRDRQGSQRVVSGLRKFYDITVIDPISETAGRVPTQGSASMQT